MSMVKGQWQCFLAGKVTDGMGYTWKTAVITEVGELHGTRCFAGIQRWRFQALPYAAGSIVEHYIKLDFIC